MDGSSDYDSIPFGKMLSIKDVQGALGIGERAVYQYVKEGRLLRPHHHGGKPWWWKGDLEVYFYRLRRGDFEGLDGGEAEQPGQEAAKEKQAEQEKEKRGGKRQRPQEG